MFCSNKVELLGIPNGLRSKPWYFGEHPTNAAHPPKLATSGFRPPAGWWLDRVDGWEMILREPCWCITGRSFDDFFWKRKALLLNRMRRSGDMSFDTLQTVAAGLEQLGIMSVLLISSFGEDIRRPHQQSSTQLIPTSHLCALESRRAPVRSGSCWKKFRCEIKDLERG